MIRSAVAADAQSMAEAHVRSWQDAYAGLMPDDVIASVTTEGRREMWDMVLESRDHRAWLAEVDGETVGLASIGPATDPEGWGQLYTIYVVGSIWGRGIGWALWTAAMSGLDELGFGDRQLFVLDTNQRARRFYERQGWQTDGRVIIDDSFGAPIREVRYAPVADFD